MNNSSRSKNNFLIGDLDKTFCNFYQVQCIEKQLMKPSNKSAKVGPNVCIKLPLT